MYNTATTSAFFAHHFQEFYREVLIQREWAMKSMEHNEPFPLPVPESHSHETPSSHDEAAAQGVLPQTAQEQDQSKENIPTKLLEKDNIEREEHKVESEILSDKIQHKFINMFERFSLHSQNQAGEFSTTQFQDFLYAMVAMLDEVFLSFPWHGQRRWKHNLMEKRFFHTQVAGELFFKKIDDLIEENDPQRNDLAAVYLMIIALGFKGKYRGEDDEGQLSWYRNQLYTLIHKHPSSLYQPGRDQLIEESYDHTINIAATKGLPNLKNWVIAFSSIIAAYVVISSFLWYGLVRDLNEAIGQIITQAQYLGLS